MFPIPGWRKLVPNPYKTWKDVNPALPNVKIEVLGPPPTSGTRDAFVELVMEEAPRGFPFIKAMDKNDFKAAAHTVREDGAYVEAGENDNLIVQKLNANPDALGIFGFSFLDQNTDTIQGSLSTACSPPSTPLPTAPTRCRARCSSTSKKPTWASSRASRNT
jgi:phosphate transport system substrate-binding protein